MTSSSTPYTAVLVDRIDISKPCQTYSSMLADRPAMSEKSTQTYTESEASSSSTSLTVDDDDAQAAAAAADFLKSFNRCSLLLGFLVGCFIQSSSLGANYILTIFFGHDRNVIQANRERIYLFSLVWSFLTSMMGVFILFFLRSLIVVHQNSTTTGNSKSKNQKEINALFVHLEYSFAFGALAGVCVSWTFTDLLLGLNVHAYHSILTLCFAIVGKFLVECTSCGDFVEDDEDDDEEEDLLAEPLLAEAPLATRSASAPTQVQAESMHGEFKFKGIWIGLLVGFFIQFSSLGASFLLDALYGQNHSYTISKKDLLTFSLAWSFLFGTMGVMILLLLRELVLMVWQQQQKVQATTTSSSAVLCEWMERLCLDLEFFFAVGCLLGVNIAWVLTDLGLGFKAHIVRSLLTLVAAAVWCKVLAYCFAYNMRNSQSTSQEGDEEEEEDGVPFKPVLIV